MKILVTGGAGFIASNIVDQYIKLGHEVVIIDNLSTGKKENINSKAKFINISITSKDVEQIFKDEKFDIVNHHAAQIDVRKSVENPEFNDKINVYGTLNLLENSVKYGVKKFIFASTGGAIYTGEDLPYTEESELGPISPYGESKLAAEFHIKAFNQEHNLNYTILRYSNVYGPRQDPLGEGGVVAIFCNNMSTDKNCLIFGDGNQTRDFVCVYDVVKANVLALTNGDNDEFNISLNQEITVNELFEVIKKKTGYKKNAEYKSSRAGEVLRSILNNSKAKNKLGWTPDYNLNKGIEKTIDWVKEFNKTNKKNN